MMVRLPRRPLPDWARLRDEAQLADQHLGPAIADALAADMTDCYKMLESPTATLDEIRVAQGTLIGLRKGTMVIEGILKRADRSLKRGGTEDKLDG